MMRWCRRSRDAVLSAFALLGVWALPNEAIAAAFETASVEAKETGASSDEAEEKASSSDPSRGEGRSVRPSLEGRLKVNARSCLSEKHLTSGVEKALEGKTLPGDLSVRISEPVDGSILIEYFRSEHLVGTRSLEVAASKCNERKRAVALLVALGIEAMLERSEAVELEESAATTPTRGQEVGERAKDDWYYNPEFEAERFRTPVTFHAEFGAAVGILASPNQNLTLGVDWPLNAEEERPLKLRFAWLVSADPVSFAGGLEGVVAAELGACWNPAKHLRTCGVLGVGIFQVRRFPLPLEGPITYQNAWLAGHLSLEGDVPLWRSLSLVGRIDGMVSLLERAEFSRLVGFASAGIAFSF